MQTSGHWNGVVGSVGGRAWNDETIWSEGGTDHRSQRTHVGHSMKTQLKVGRDRETEAHLFDIVMAVTFRKLKRRGWKEIRMWRVE